MSASAGFDRSKMDPASRRVFDLMVDVTREAYGVERPVGTCPECRCALYAGATRCDDAGCPIVPFPEGRAA